MIPMMLIAALIQVESGGNSFAVGDAGRSLGCLQISEAVLMDVAAKVPHADPFNRLDAIRVCNAYLTKYATAARLGREPTLEDMARIWNGGPSGWKKPETRAYWLKVKRELDRRHSVTGNEYRPA